MDTGAGDGTFTYQCSTGSSGVISCGSSTSNVATFLATTTVATSEQVVLTRDANLDASLDLLVTENGWQEGATEAPEPSTQLLCGAALLGLAASGWRRKRA